MVDLISDLTEIARKFRKRNALAAVAAMIVVLSAYIAGFSLKEGLPSDNIGVLVVPLFVFTIHGPAASLICGFLETRWILRKFAPRKIEFRTLLWETQPRFVLNTGWPHFVLKARWVGVVLCILSLGPCAVFPFWPYLY